MEFALEPDMLWGTTFDFMEKWEIKYFHWHKPHGKRRWLHWWSRLGTDTILDELKWYKQGSFRNIWFELTRPYWHER